jgi:GTP pyrophosphokinase
VQIRTLEMHRMAEEGRRRRTGSTRKAARRRHRDDRYFQLDAPAARHPAGGARSAGGHPEPEGRALSREVYTFTPKGQVKAFAARRDAIDFAVLDHTDVGISASARASTARWCRCARRLKNGDIVEIVHAGWAQAEPRLAELRRHRRTRATRSST